MASCISLYRYPRHKGEPGEYGEVVRFPKASQFLNWLMKNVLNTSEIPYGGDEYEISKDQLENLLEACIRTRRYGIVYHSTKVHKGGFEEHEYKVNEEVVRSILPLFEKDGHLYFPYFYESIYAQQVIEAIQTLNEIISTTNFDIHKIMFAYH